MFGPMVDSSTLWTVGSIAVLVVALIVLLPRIGPRIAAALRPAPAGSPTLDPTSPDPTRNYYRHTRQRAQDEADVIRHLDELRRLREKELEMLGFTPAPPPAPKRTRATAPKTGPAAKTRARK